MPRESDEITIRLAGLHNGLDAEACAVALLETIAGLRELDKSMSEFGSETVSWQIVESAMNSPLLTKLRGVPTSKTATVSAKAVAAAWVAGISALQSTNACPQYFTEPALRHAASLSSLFARRLSQIEYTCGGKSARASGAVFENANFAIRVLESKRLRERGKRREHGSIDGHLSELSAQASKDKIVVVDRLSGFKTRCYFHDEELEQRAREAWKKRVEVTGEITTDTEGRPAEMAVERMRIFRDRSALPQMKDLFGIDITGGIEPSEYVRRLHDDE